MRSGGCVRADRQRGDCASRRRATPGSRARTFTISNSPSRSRDAFSAPGVCIVASLTRKEGWAERRETFGCCAKHPLGVHITRHARRLRGALRPMTQQYTGRNSVTISMPDWGSVPIVSQTEIEPMKTALSLMLALITTTALTEPLPVPKPPGGRAARARTAISRAAHSARRRRARRRRLPRSGSIVVDLVEPGWQPLAWPANVVQQQVFRDTVPWVVIRVCS